MKTIPSIFVSHGAPTLPLEASPAHDFLSGLGAAIGRPRAILVVSAHWEADSAAVSAAAWPETMYDFYGFPEELYRLRYPAPGTPQLAERAAPPPAWVTEFNEWLAVTLLAGRASDLVAYRSKAPHAVRNHPTEEHLLPLFVAAGAAGTGGTAERLHSSYAYGVIGMDAYRFD